MSEKDIEPKDAFHELRNGVFNFVVTLFQEEERSRGRTWAKQDVSSYLEQLASHIRDIDADKEGDNA